MGKVATDHRRPADPEPCLEAEVRRGARDVLKGIRALGASDGRKGGRDGRRVGDAAPFWRFQSSRSAKTMEIHLWKTNFEGWRRFLNAFGCFWARLAIV